MSTPAPDARRIDIVLWVSVLLMTVVMGVIFIRVAQLQVAPSESLSAHIQERVTRRTQPAQRGEIVDRRGRLLATTRTGYRLFVDPSRLKPPFGSTIAEISDVTGVDVETVGEIVVGRVAENERRAAAGRKPIRYATIGGILDDAQLEAARRLKIPGVHLEIRSVRDYPGGDIVAPIVGKVGVDHDGLLGVELAHDPEMQPTPGHFDFVRDAFGRPMWVEPTGYRPPHKGDDLRLTLDLEVQRICAEELKRGVHEADAAGGRLVMVDPRTGDILAMVDYVRPGMDLKEPPAREKLSGRIIEPDSTGNRYRTIRDDKSRDIHPALARNRCVEDVYEPGSTFKSFIWASITERGLAAPDEVFDTHGGRWTTDYGRAIADVTPKDYLSWRDVLVFSSNIGMVQGAARMKFDQTRRDILRFGFGQRVNIGFGGESPGIVTPINRWSKYTQTSIASGYEVAVTPLQIVRAFSVFARTGDLAGTLPNLRLHVNEDYSPVDEVRVRVLPAWTSYLTRDTLQKVGQMMEERARRRFPDEPPLRYTLFAKSGTAEIPRPDGKGYFKGQYNSSFLAGAPVDDPRIVLVVVIDDPGPEMIRKRMHYGTAVAGPVVRRVVRRTLEYFGVPVAGDPVAELLAAEAVSADGE